MCVYVRVSIYRFENILKSKSKFGKNDMNFCLGDALAKQIS